MRVAVLALNGVFDLGLAAVREAFQTANELNAMTGLGVPRFDVSIIGVRRAVRSAHGLRVPVEPSNAMAPDCVVIPAIGYKMPGPLSRALDSPEIRAAGTLLRRWSARRARLGAACVGTFVLAESGLLDGRRATTTWWLAPLFRLRYPSVELDESQMIVPAGDVVTAGAALSHLDLALWIVRSLSPELAALTARYLIADSRPSQAVYALADHLAHTDPVVQRFERWTRSRLARGFSLAGAAQAAGVSQRTLARRLHRVLGKSPVDYVQRLRIERAVHLLKTTHASIDAIAAQVGYADGSTLRALIRRRLGVGVRDLRR